MMKSMIRRHLGSVVSRNGGHDVPRSGGNIVPPTSVALSDLTTMKATKVRASDPGMTFVIVLVIGLAAGLVFDRLAGPSWLARQFSGSTSGIITSALVGVAGAFVGYHIAVPLTLGGGLLTSVIAAALGAAVVLFGWRMAK
jgi:uncharacterized membrane protein YeaQ/YmgE (transglycosylase-associated protein family)